MKVKGLIKRLQTIADQDKEIYMASDAEGNTFHDIDEVTDTQEHTVIIWPNHNNIEYLGE